MSAELFDIFMCKESLVFPKGDHKALLFYMREWGKMKVLRKPLGFFGVDKMGTCGIIVARILRTQALITQNILAENKVVLPWRCQHGGTKLVPVCEQSFPSKEEEKDETNCRTYF